MGAACWQTAAVEMTTDPAGQTLVLTAPSTNAPIEASSGKVLVEGACCADPSAELYANNDG